MPGQQVACACPAGKDGAQTCDPSGAGYGPCIGCVAGGDAAEPSVDATQDAPRKDVTVVSMKDAAGDVSALDALRALDAGAPDGAASDALASDGAPDAPLQVDASACFSSGQWLIQNVSPCLVLTSASTASDAVSTYQAGDGGAAMCPDTQYLADSPPEPQPGEPWSTDTFRVNCTGQFHLCYALKAGTYESPQPSDCTVVSVCIDTDYTIANLSQPAPPLPGWTATDPACAETFNLRGGYGEMSATGPNVPPAGGPLVFNRLKYCAAACGEAYPPDAGCGDCTAGASGLFGP